MSASVSKRKGGATSIGVFWLVTVLTPLVEGLDPVWKWAISIFFLGVLALLWLPSLKELGVRTICIWASSALATAGLGQAAVSLGWMPPLVGQGLVIPPGLWFFWALLPISAAFWWEGRAEASAHPRQVSEEGHQDLLSWRTAMDSTKVRQKLESDLRSLSNEHAHAKFGVWAPEQVLVVLGLGSVFEAAGWKINMNKTPQGLSNLGHHDREGIEVRGWNEHRVKAVVGYLSEHFHGVYAKMEPITHSPDNQKMHNFVVNRVRLTVYREPPID